LQAPAGSDGDPAEGPTLRLQFREVWWAAAFGLQPLGTTIRWAQVQWAEQMRHILVPVGRLTRRTVAQTGLHPDASDPPSWRPYRPLLNSALAIYSAIEHLWKIVQWLVLSPFIALLLLLMSMARVVSSIGIIQNALLATFNGLSSYVMLHWIASTQVYMRDYARAASIRHLFERELDDFLRDERCDRVVVLAHSMGTVIAYEGLTTLPRRLGAEGTQKSITFICLAQALRRVWLLPGIDARRLRGVLPDGIHWLHFWARYDPVAAGPLTPSTLPRPATWTDQGAPAPYEAIRASLQRCQNIPVVNTDSSFTDHTTYWENLEQVVGPIALELVDV
jgi:hypothetical protein